MKNERSTNRTAQVRSLDQRLSDSPELAEMMHALLDEMEGSLAQDALADEVEERVEKSVRKRREHLDYAGAREKKLPIGSGEVESAHLHLIQPRLKIPGAWKETHAQQMLSLRTARANGLWEKSWNFHLN